MEKDQTVGVAGVRQATASREDTGKVDRDRRQAGLAWWSGGSRERLCVFNLTRQTFLSLGITMADTHWGRLVGLIGRVRLRHDEGLWLIPSQGVHTIGVFCPIDVVFLDQNLRVVEIVEHLKPFRVSPLRLRSASVLQLPSRSVYWSRTQVGDCLLICKPSELGQQTFSRDDADDLPSVGISHDGHDDQQPEHKHDMTLREYLRGLLRPNRENLGQLNKALPPLVAFFWEGGVSRPHEVSEVSLNGLRVKSDLTFPLGTVLEFTLQVKTEPGAIPGQAPWVYVRSQVVSVLDDGMRVRFVTLDRAERKRLKQFFQAVRKWG